MSDNLSNLGPSSAVDPGSTVPVPAPGDGPWTGDRLVQFLIQRDAGWADAHKDQWQSLMQTLKDRDAKLIATLQSVGQPVSLPSASRASTFTPAFVQGLITKITDNISMKRLAFYGLLVWEILFYDKAAGDSSPDSVVEIVKALIGVVQGGGG